jgi:hypothetical protein
MEIDKRTMFIIPINSLYVRNPLEKRLIEYCIIHGTSYIKANIARCGIKYFSYVVISEEFGFVINDTRIAILSQPIFVNGELMHDIKYLVP